MTAGEDHLLWSGSRHRRLATRARPGTSPTFGPVHNDRDGQDIRGSINWTFTDYSGATGGDSPAFAWCNRQIVDSAVQPRTTRARKPLLEQVSHRHPVGVQRSSTVARITHSSHPVAPASVALLPRQPSAGRPRQ